MKDKERKPEKPGNEELAASKNEEGESERKIITPEEAKDRELARVNLERFIKAL